MTSRGKCFIAFLTVKRFSRPWLRFAGLSEVVINQDDVLVTLRFDNADDSLIWWWNNQVDMNWLGWTYVLLLLVCSLFSDRVAEVVAVLESLLWEKKHSLTFTPKWENYCNRFGTFEHYFKRSLTCNNSPDVSRRTIRCWRSLTFCFWQFVNSWMWGRRQMSFKTAGIRKRLLARLTDKLRSTLMVHAFDTCFYMIFSRERSVAFRALYFLWHLTMHRSQVLLKIALIAKKLCTHLSTVGQR